HVGARLVLWLAVPVRRPSGTGQHHCAELPSWADPYSNSITRATDRSEIPTFPGSVGRLVLFLGPCDEIGGGGALQWCHLPSVRYVIADGRLRGYADRCQHLRRKILLPIHLPARCGPFDIRPGAYVQLAEAASGVWHAMPNLRGCLPGGRDQAKREDRHERVLLLPR